MSQCHCCEGSQAEQECSICGSLTCGECFVGNICLDCKIEEDLNEQAQWEGDIDINIDDEPPIRSKKEKVRVPKKSPLENEFYPQVKKKSKKDFREVRKLREVSEKDDDEDDYRG